MKFGRYVTAWEALPAKRKAHGAPFAYYQRILECASGMTSGQLSYIKAMTDTEMLWLAGGQPYYKVWPGYTAMLLHASLAVPTSAFHVPHKAFAIFLPVGLDMLKFDIGGAVPHELTEVLIAMEQPKGHPKRRLVAMAGNITICNGPMVFYGTIDDSVGRTMEEVIEAVPTDEPRLRPMTRAMIRLALTVSLLATSVHRYIEHDVIKNLRERYDKAPNDKVREELAEKSRKRGVNGWRIGRGCCLSLTTRHADDESGSNGRHLSFQHVRGGHFHTYWTGVGRTKAKVRFVEPTVVRPDLPPPIQ